MRYGQRRLNLLLVLPGFPQRDEESAMPAVINLIERIGRVHDVTVVALHHPRASRHFKRAGANVVSLALPRGRGPAGRAAVLGAGLAMLVRCHRRRRLDVIHGLWADEPGSIAALGGRMLRVPSIVSAMGGELVGLPDIGYGAALGRGGRATVRLALRLADTVTAGSSYLAAQLVDACRELVPVVAQLGVDTTLFHPPAAPEFRQHQVLFVGSLAPVKDPAAALRVFAQAALAEPSWKLLMCGSGSLRESLERQSVSLGIADRTRFAGHISQAELAQLYRASPVLLVTSRHEAQHVAAIEAAASGLAIVGYALGALPDLGAAARTAAPGDEAGLATQLREVLADASLRSRMGEQARHAAVTDFDLDRCSQRFLDLYSALANPRSVSAR